jgi:hypothetical protein
MMFFEINGRELVSTFALKPDDMPRTQVGLVNHPVKVQLPTHLVG